MNIDKISEAAKALVGLSYPDWLKLRSAVDLEFAKKERELERTLELSADDDVVTPIREQFG